MRKFRSARDADSKRCLDSAEQPCDALNYVAISTLSLKQQTLSNCRLHIVIYTVNHKKRDILFLTITLANLNRFL